MRREPVKSWKERKWNGKYVNTAFIYEILKKKKTWKMTGKIQLPIHTRLQRCEPNPAGFLQGSLTGHRW